MYTQPSHNRFDLIHLMASSRERAWNKREKEKERERKKERERERERERDLGSWGIGKLLT